MEQSELLFSFSSISIALVLFVAIMSFNELSFRLGRVVQASTDDEVKALTGAVQGSILGLLALLLGFTFSMSMQRFDNRSMALIDEANAIGTALLRVQLLPEAYQPQAKSLFKEYIKLRVQVSKVPLDEKNVRMAFDGKVAEIQNQLWQLAVAVSKEDPRPVTSGAFTQALNAAIDSQGKRNAILRSHVPEPILFLLFVVFVASVGIMGYSSGLTGKRITLPLTLVSFLITLIVFIIIDLDRPKRGLIKVNQSALQELILFTRD
ncbi:hypothetical protein OPS25_08320 [Alteromonas ponticola]|uniref:DUF4239 domain-containing protein n=1 Tax=Alteromonas aquimaris TaxID=2998417 RepID=A0ABT3P6W1_9ALTE|nr:hypothetical protein [Alteromonas aquimaris]MCW8108498.1 hypothetical protein [Alteromonas aquimaris]